MSTVEPTPVPVSKLPTYSIVTLVITGALALASILFILLVLKQSKNLDREDEEDVKEPPRQPKKSVNDAVVPIKDKDTPAPVEQTPAETLIQAKNRTDDPDVMLYNN